MKKLYLREPVWGGTREGGHQAVSQRCVITRQPRTDSTHTPPRRLQMSDVECRSLLGESWHVVLDSGKRRVADLRSALKVRGQSGATLFASGKCLDADDESLPPSPTDGSPLVVHVAPAVDEPELWELGPEWDLPMDSPTTLPASPSERSLALDPVSPAAKREEPSSTRQHRNVLGALLLGLSIPLILCTLKARYAASSHEKDVFVQKPLVNHTSFSAAVRSCSRARRFTGHHEALSPRPTAITMPAGGLFQKANIQPTSPSTRTPTSISSASSYFPFGVPSASSALGHEETPGPNTHEVAHRPRWGRIIAAPIVTTVAASLVLSVWKPFAHGLLALFDRLHRFGVLSTERCYAIIRVLTARGAIATEKDRICKTT